MQPIVLDTNSLIMAISSRNRYHKVWQAFLQGDYILCITNEIIEEYHEVFPSVAVIGIDDFLKEL